MYQISRREALQLGCGLAAIPALALDQGVLVNDIHSQLNATRVERIVTPRSVDELRDALLAAGAQGKSVSIAGGRHAMGGQQFGAGAVLIDMRSLNAVRGIDAGVVDVEAGIQWPKLIDYLDGGKWGIIQKQTGADRLSLGGALAANAHGRGLTLKPIIDQVESFDLLDHSGELRFCDRKRNAELFRLVIGGYGLFGIVTAIRLRLRPRIKVERVVELAETHGIMAAFEKRIAEGYLYGDFQFTTDGSRESFLRRGVFSCYRPADPSTPITQGQKRFTPEDWARLTYYSHKYKRRAFDVYTRRYLSTSGQIYWADSQLSGAYVDNYHQDLDRRLGARVKATEMITEIYVPRRKLAGFMEEARVALNRHKANVIYGTVRLIEQDDESFLAWARERFACVIFNLHTVHTPEGIEKSAEAFRALIDLGIRCGGSYYLTYHRYASREQVDACYPQFREFLRQKLRYDPQELFQSEWYRHHKTMFAV